MEGEERAAKNEKGIRGERERGTRGGGDGDGGGRVKLEPESRARIIYSSCGAPLLD